MLAIRVRGHPDNEQTYFTPFRRRCLLAFSKRDKILTKRRAKILFYTEPADWTDFFRSFTEETVLSVS